MPESSSPRKRYQLADFDEIKPLRCPCGWTRRAYVDQPKAPASMHRVTIEGDSQAHVHKATTEIYYVLSGRGALELDDDTIPVRAGQSVMILPGCHHRAVGTMTILNVAIPAFDPDDEFPVDTGTSYA